MPVSERSNVTPLSSARGKAGRSRPYDEAHAEAVRMAEAIIFASAEPVTEKALQDRLPDGSKLPQILNDLQALYGSRGVNLVRRGDGWAFRTAEDLGYVLQKEKVQQRRLSRAATEILAIIAYHQPVTRAEMEDIRGVVTSKGTLDVLLETGWVKLRGRRRTPGRPVTYGTSPSFLDHFGLEELDDLPGLEELKGSGLLQGRIPDNLVPGHGDMPGPAGSAQVDSDELTEDEEPFSIEDLEELGLLTPMAESVD